MKLSHLYPYHIANARMTEFAGFKMPLWYEGIMKEHMAVRNTAGLFDVGHMGRFLIKGKDATKFLGFLLPSNVSKVPSGRAFYSTMCNERGGIVDDLITLKMGEERYIMVVNASNREKDWAWVKGRSEGFDLDIEDISDSVALLALQGPKAEAVLRRMTDAPLSSLRRYHHLSSKIGEVDVIVSRTGYTGEDGFELFILECPLRDPAKAEGVWEAILSEGRPEGLAPCGLGARDTLRLEAGLCLYGSDIEEGTTPLEAKLDWVVSFNKGDFIGKEALLEQVRRGVLRVRVGLVMKAEGIPRASYEIWKGDKVVGSVTSGTYSPLLKKGIAMGYVPKELDVVGNEMKISMRGALKDAVITEMPFYDTRQYGWKARQA